MTDRFNALIVVLEKDMRDDDAEHLINAIKMLKGVLSVEGNVADSIGEYATEMRVHREYRDKLLEIMK